MSDIELSPREREIIQKYDLSMEGSEDWDENRWDEYEINNWDLEQELRERYYEIFPAKEMEESEDDKEEARRWLEEEEAAAREYFRKLEEEETKNKDKKEKVEEDIYYSEDEEEEETMEKGDTGGKEKEPADNRVNGPIDTSIPQEMTTPPEPCESKDAATVEESTKAMDEKESAGKSTKEMDKKESPDEGII